MRGNAVDAFLQFRIGRLHLISDEGGELVEISVIEASKAAIAHGAAHDFAQDIAAPFVGRDNAIVNKKRRSAGVIGIDAERGFGAIVGTAFHVQQFSGLLHNGLDQIGVIVRQVALQNGGEPLEPHAGINGRLRQRRQFAVGRTVKLHENQIPDFDEAAAAIKRKLFVFAAFFGGFRAQIVMNFRARAAGAGFAHLPEIIFFVEAKNAALWVRPRLFAKAFPRRHLREKR